MIRNMADLIRKKISSGYYFNGWNTNNWINDIKILNSQQNNYCLKHGFYTINIYILLFISLLIFSFFIVQKTILTLLIFGITLSTIIAFKFPKTFIVLTILLGQIIQFELNEVFSINAEKLSFSNVMIRLSDPLIFGMAITIFLKFFSHNKLLIKFIKNDGLYFSLFLFYLILQIIRNINLYDINSFGEFRTYYQFLLFIPYLVINLKKSDDRRTAFLILLSLSLLHILFGLIKGGALYYFRFEAYNKWLSNFGSLALLYGMFALFLVKTTETFKVNGLITSFIFLTGISIILISSSRAAWIAGIAGLFIIILLGQFKLNNFLTLLLLSPILFYILLCLFEYSKIDMFLFFETRLAAFFEYESDPTASWRHSFWLSAVAKIKENFLFGHGLGQHFQIYIPELKETISTSPHNLYLTILFHSGILGLTLYSLFIINIFINMKKTLKIIRERYIVLTGMVVLFSVHFYGIANSFEKDFFTWMYVGLGISVVVNSNNNFYAKN
jgi:O-antigen ligase